MFDFFDEERREARKRQRQLDEVLEDARDAYRQLRLLTDEARDAVSGGMGQEEITALEEPLAAIGRGEELLDDRFFRAIADGDLDERREELERLVERGAEYLEEWREEGRKWKYPYDQDKQAKVTREHMRRLQSDLGNLLRPGEEVMARRSVWREDSVPEFTMDEKPAYTTGSKRSVPKEIEERIRDIQTLQELFADDIANAKDLRNKLDEQLIVTRSAHERIMAWRSQQDAETRHENALEDQDESAARRQAALASIHGLD